MKKITTLILCLTLFVAVGAYAQDTPFDLAGNISSTTYSVKANQPLTIKIIDFLPSGHYTINQTIKPNIIPPLNLPSSDDTDTSKSHLAKDKTPESCIATNEVTLKTIKTETDFKALMDKTKTDCPAFYQKYLLASTYTKKFDKLRNETLTLTITNTDTKQTWTLIYQTEDEGQFVTLYGFTFIPYIFTKPHTYFAQASTSADGKYTVSRGSSEGIADYAPTVSFHYITTTANIISGSLTAGLGAAFNTSDNSGISPVVILGYSLLFHENFGINVGVASDLVNKLKGQYANGQVITTNLESSDLTEKTIGFNPFISVVFRFGSSPFSVKKPSSTAVVAPPASSSSN